MRCLADGGRGYAEPGSSQRFGRAARHSLALHEVCNAPWSGSAAYSHSIVAGGFELMS